MTELLNKKFLDLLEKNDLSKDAFQEQISYLHKIKREKITLRLSKQESKDVGSVIYNINYGLIQYFNSNFYKFVDLFEAMILSINSKNYSSAITLGRSIFEHFAMFIYKTQIYIKFLNKKDYLKLAIDLSYWGTPEPLRLMHPNYKRTHIMDAVRNLDIFYNNKNKSKKYFETMYHNFSENVHPASNSINMTHVRQAEKAEKDEKWDKDGLSIDVYFDTETDEAFLTELIWIIGFIPSELVAKIIPLYNNSILGEWDKIKFSAYDYFKNNPKKANEILANTIDKKLSDLNRSVNNLEDIDIKIHKEFK